MKVEIWSDVVCPWCYIGKRRLEHALGEFEHADEVTIAWRSFQLNPDTPPGTAVPTARYLAERFGPQAGQLTGRVAELARAEGLDFDFDAALDTDRAREVLAGPDYTDAVQADIELARAFGATGVPFFVIDRTYGISGAQPAETFLQALRTAYTR
jgi:predicted DsbA family dithiol-disulfide isomerase